MKDFKKHIQKFYTFSIFLLVAFHLCSYSKKAMLPAKAGLANTSNIIKTFLALGDSYTIGQSVPLSENFPNQTVALLRANFQVEDPDIIATTGWTTSDLIYSIRNNPPHHIYSFVTLLIGVNNQYQGKSIEEYKNQFTLLLNTAKKLADNVGEQVYVLSIPDYSVTPFAEKLDTSKIAKEIDSYNSINRSISLVAGVNYIDITQISRQAKNNPSLTAGDGLHPSASQYKLWATVLADAVTKR
jgi:lysophospholipase L1-like esterase